MSLKTQINEIFKDLYKFLTLIQSKGGLNESIRTIK